MLLKPMPRRAAIIAAIALTAAALALLRWVLATKFYPVRNAPVAGHRIVAFGDSLIAGSGASPGRDFVSLLSLALQRPIVNAGLAGDTTTAALSRLSTVLEEHRPDLVIVLLGGNDALQRVPRAATVANLRRIITDIQNQGAAVLLLGVRGGAVGDPYRREFAKLARHTGAAYVPNVLDSVWGNHYLMADEVHPNDLGHAVIFDRVLPAVRQLLRPQ